MKHGPVEIQSFTFNPFNTNSFVVSCGSEAIIVDASGYDQADADAILGYIASKDLSVTRLILTHAHIDHIFGCGRLAAALGLGWELGARDVPLLQNGYQQAKMFGVTLEDTGEVAAFLSAGDTIELGEAKLRVADVPGHSPGSIALIDAENGYALSGDVLFRESIGRTDLWMGDYATLLKSIHTALLTLDDSVTVYSGHGPETTIGHERRANPFLND